jgi:thiosulfate dehydrogenase
MKEDNQPLIKLIPLLVFLLGLTVALVSGMGVVLFLSNSHISLLGFEENEPPATDLRVEIPEEKALAEDTDMWKAPDWESVTAEINAQEIRYGKELIENTSDFFGPNGKVIPMSNGMNCQNCHLHAGTVPWGNNYGAVNATYPKMRARSGTIEDIQKRINDCFERSLNGQPLERDSREMKAMAAYINWLGKDVPKGQTPKGAGIYELPLLDRPADPIRGELVYENHCQKCHSADGEGVPVPDGSGEHYPPLWGKRSFTTGAGLFRLSRFAGYVKANMPFGTTFEKPVLTDEEAWDVAAYVNSLERPGKDLSRDWPDISKKPIDHPFGPYTDGFDEQQHKFGPFKPIQQARMGAKP